jgi:hypothetical protein
LGVKCAIVFLPQESISVSSIKLDHQLNTLKTLLKDTPFPFKSQERSNKKQKASFFFIPFSNVKTKSRPSYEETGFVIFKQSNRRAVCATA